MRGSGAARFGCFQVPAFHLGLYFKKPVAKYSKVVAVNRPALEYRQSTSDFTAANRHWLTWNRNLGYGRLSLWHFLHQFQLDWRLFWR